MLRMVAPSLRSLALISLLLLVTLAKLKDIRYKLDTRLKYFDCACYTLCGAKYLVTLRFGADFQQLPVVPCNAHNAEICFYFVKQN